LSFFFFNILNCITGTVVSTKITVVVAVINGTTKLRNCSAHHMIFHCQPEPIGG